MTATNHGLEGWRDKAEFRAQIDVWAQKLDVEADAGDFSRNAYEVGFVFDQRDVDAQY